MIRLNIIHFSLESDRFEEGVCPHDYDTLRLYDGRGQHAPLLGEFCGPFIPDTITSTGKHMYVVFKSDESKNEEGYLASFSFDKGEFVG